MKEKLRTAAWFARRPSHWAQAGALALRKFLPDHDTPDLRNASRDWAAARAVPIEEALASVGLEPPVGTEIPRLSKMLLDEAKARAEFSQVEMGGAGDINLLYAVTVLSGARRAIETGVAYGWSSLAILAAFDKQESPWLVSVDMPYPKMNNEAFVGLAVPERLRGAWEIVREPDRNGLKKAIARLGGAVDLCHYDSDKSWWGRKYGYPLMWNALTPGGLFISDDIQDNMAFAEFVAERELSFAVTAFEGKFVGITRKI